MLTDRDLSAGVAAMLKAAQEAKKPLTADEAEHYVRIIINAVDHARNPVSVGVDVVDNLLRPSKG